MSKTDFAKCIISHMDSAISKDGTQYSESTPAMANQAVAEAVTEYIIKNAEVASTYSGSTPTAPDPVTSDKHGLIGSCPPVAAKDNLQSWLDELCNNIKNAFFVAPGEKGVTFACNPIHVGSASVPDLSKIPHLDSKDPQLECWELVCGCILDWINSQPPTSPTGGSRPPGGSSGTAFSSMVSLP